MEEVKPSAIKPNPSNPRIIRDDKFAKLVQSLKDFPEMANVRPVVVNADGVILGGNMRFRAMVEAGWKKIPIERVDWPEEKQREFIIKDNVSGGEWDWDVLANEWDAGQLDEWGVEVPYFGHEANSMTEGGHEMPEGFDPYGAANGQQRVTFIFESANACESWLKANHPSLDVKRTPISWQVNLDTRFT
jgi:ParB-like nuclease domain